MHDTSSLISNSVNCKLYIISVVQIAIAISFDFSEQPGHLVLITKLLAAINAHFKTQNAIPAFNRFFYPSSPAHCANKTSKAKAIQPSKYDNHSHSYSTVLVKEVFYTTKRLH